LAVPGWAPTQTSWMMHKHKRRASQAVAVERAAQRCPFFFSSFKEKKENSPSILVNSSSSITSYQKKKTRRHLLAKGRGVGAHEANQAS
jgi:hypothetical protein